jgi:hypothetical protein
LHRTRQLAAKNHAAVVVPSLRRRLKWFFIRAIFAAASSAPVKRPLGDEGYAMKISYEDTLEKPVEVVFPWIAEPKKAIQWQNNVKGGEIIIEKKEIVGTTFKEMIEEDGQSLEMYGKITQYAENKLIEFQLESKVHKLLVVYIVEKMNNNTKIIIKANINWKFPMNIISLFIGRRMKDGIQNQMKTEIQQLRRILANI